jgi:hypothetical protein
MWRSLKHQFVLPFLGIHEITNTRAPQFFLVSPYMRNGTLCRWRKQANPSIAIIEEHVRLRLFLTFILCLTRVGRYWKLRKPWNTSIQKAPFMAISAGYSTSDTLCYCMLTLLSRRMFSWMIIFMSKSLTLV